MGAMTTLHIILEVKLTTELIAYEGGEVYREVRGGGVYRRTGDDPVN